MTILQLQSIVESLCMGMSTGCTLVRVHDHDYTSAPEYSRVPLHG